MCATGKAPLERHCFARQARHKRRGICICRALLMRLQETLVVVVAAAAAALTTHASPARPLNNQIAGYAIRPTYVGGLPLQMSVRDFSFFCLQCAAQICRQQIDRQEPDRHGHNLKLVRRHISQQILYSETMPCRWFRPHEFSLTNRNTGISVVGNGRIC